MSNDQDPEGKLSVFVGTSSRTGSSSENTSGATGPVEVGDFTGGADSPLAAAAVPLLGLADRLRTMSGHVDVDAVHACVYQELQRFANASREANIPSEILDMSHYALAATIDDIVMSTPWGADSGWIKRTMVGTFHGALDGEGFYERLERMMQSPSVNRPVLQLMHDCLTLGFLGRLRLRARGLAEHAEVREKLWHTLRHLD